jgi:GTP pyrophosphokinase
LSLVKLGYEAERRIPVTWDVRREATYPARILVMTQDQPGVLANVSAAIAACQVNISRSSTETTPDKKAHLEFTIDVRDADHLSETLRRVEGLRGVLSVERLKNTSRRAWHV